MKKRFFAVLCVTAIVMTGCSSTGSKNDAENTPAVEKTAQADETTPEAATPESVETEAATPAPAELVLDGEIFDGTKSSMENQVPLGQWTSIEMHNAKSGKNEPCYIRVNKVIRDEAEVQSLIADYNNTYSDKLEVEEDYKDLFELVAIDYELGYPAEWTTENGTIFTPLNVTFVATNNDGKVGFPTTDGERYMGGYTSSVDLLKGREDYPTPGSCIKCTAIVEMAKGFDDFCLKIDTDEVYFKTK